jgi:hypothetical protein
MYKIKKLVGVFEKIFKVENSLVTMRQALCVLVHYLFNKFWCILNKNESKTQYCALFNLA